MPSGRFPNLLEPPINEVVCGFIFQSIPELTPTQHGVYWARRQSEFPNHEVQPILVDPSPGGDQFEFSFDPKFIRTWLISSDETRLIQIQHDRVFTNWRKRRTGDTYPRFHARGNKPGLLAFALDEFKKISGFIHELGLTPEVHHLELTKIDVLVQGHHWSDLQDLRAILPWTGTSIDLANTDRPTLLLRFEEKTDDGTIVRVTAANGIDRDTKVRVIRLETTIRTPGSSVEMEAGFQAMNEQVNSMFFKLIPESELGRFKVETT